VGVPGRQGDLTQYWNITPDERAVCGPLSLSLSSQRFGGDLLSPHVIHLPLFNKRGYSFFSSPPTPKAGKKEVEAGKRHDCKT